jgi:non-specific serine/threonine protein kinase
VSALLRASLLVAEGEGDEPRFTMLETICDFAAERLLDAGELETTRAAHAAYFLALAEAAEPWLRSSEQRKWLDQLEREIDNLRAALRSFLEAAHAERGLRLASALQWFWWDRGYWHEGREWLSQLLALPGPVSPPVRATALNAASFLASSCGEYDLAIALGDESLAIARAAGDDAGMAWARAYLAVAQYRRGDIVAARAVGEESLDAFRALGLREGMLLTLGYVGLAAQDAGDDAAARPLLEEAVELARQIGDRDNLSRALLGLAFRALYNQHDVETARGYFSEGLTISADLGHPYPLIYSLEGLASIAAAEGRPRRAWRLAGAAAALREARQAVPAPQLLAKHQQALAAIQDALPPAEREAALAEGRAMPQPAAIAYALASDD